MWQNHLQKSVELSALYCICLFILHGLAAFAFPSSWVTFLKTSKLRNELNNRIISTIHATFMFSLTMKYWFSMNKNVSIIRNTHYEAMCLDIMMGYLWYDVVIELSFTGQLDTLGHHILGMISHLSTRLSNNEAAAFYSMMVFIAEGSTPFLNTCWLLHQMGLKDSLLFIICAGSLLLTFFVFRIVMSTFIVAHFATHKESWGENNDLLFVGNFLVIILFAALNYFWFYKLLMMATKVPTSKENTTKGD